MHERDLIGYGARPPDPEWPGGARLALSFVLNYEEGAEPSPVDGDRYAEYLLSELTPAPPVPGVRNRNIESAYEYGSRVGVWRILRCLEERGIVPTINAVGQALARNPAVAEATAKLGCDYIGHGWRWIDHADLHPEEERAHIARTVETVERLTGERPLGWYAGRPSAHTRRLVVEEGGFLFDCDDYNDDLPYWVTVAGRPHLVLPHSLDTNDSRFARYQGFETAEDFFVYMRDAFDCLYAEGAERPGMMTVSLHCRLIGRPGRMAGLARFIEHAQAYDGVWFCRRSDIARHWQDTHPATHPPA